MIYDSEIQNWAAKHGSVTSFNFFVYGEPTDEEKETLTHGVLLSLTPSKIKEVAIFFDSLTEDEAVAFECYRGSPLSFLFAGDVSFLEDHIKNLTVEGIEDYFRYKTEYLGMQRTESNV